MSNKKVISILRKEKKDKKLRTAVAGKYALVIVDIKCPLCSKLVDIKTNDRMIMYSVIMETAIVSCPHCFKDFNIQLF